MFLPVAVSLPSNDLRFFLDPSAEGSGLTRDSLFLCSFDLSRFSGLNKNKSGLSEYSHAGLDARTFVLTFSFSTVLIVLCETLMHHSFHLLQSLMPYVSHPATLLSPVSWEYYISTVFRVLEEVWLRSSRLRFCLNSICRGNIGSSFVSFTLEL
jgi:hypothetical protein